MKKLLLIAVLLGAFTSPLLAQEPLRPEGPGVHCKDENEPLNPKSSEARRLLNSDDPNDRYCAQLRIELYEQQEDGIEFEEETPLEYLPGTNPPGYLEGALSPLLELLKKLFGGIV